MKNQKSRSFAIALPMWHYTNKQRQLATLNAYFTRLCYEGEVTWARQEGNPFAPKGNGTYEAGVASRNAVFKFRVANGFVVEGWMY